MSTDARPLSIVVNTCSRVEDEDPEHTCLLADVTVSIGEDSWTGTASLYPDRSLWITEPLQLAAKQTSPLVFEILLRREIVRAGRVIDAANE